MGEAVRLWMRSGPRLPALKEAFAALAAAAIATLLALKPQIIYQRRLFGSLMIDGYGAQGEGFNWLDPHVHGVLFTTHNGLIPFHPLAALGLLGLGLGLLSRQHVRVAAVFLAMVAINVYVQAAWWAWTMGTSFGARGLLNSWLLLTRRAGAAGSPPHWWLWPYAWHGRWCCSCCFTHTGFPTMDRASTSPACRNACGKQWKPWPPSSPPPAAVPHDTQSQSNA
jgi:hypothetical protein